MSYWIPNAIGLFRLTIADKDASQTLGVQLPSFWLRDVDERNQAKNVEMSHVCSFLVPAFKRGDRSGLAEHSISSVDSAGSCRCLEVNRQVRVFDEAFSFAGDLVRKLERLVWIVRVVEVVVSDFGDCLN